MSDIYTGIDIGTDSIKIIVLEKINDDYHVLASCCSKSAGIENGFITDTKVAVNSVKAAVKKINEMLGIKISKAIVCIPPTNCKMNIVNGKVAVLDYNEITGADISNVLIDAIKKEDYQTEEIVTAMPISFNVDGKPNIDDPKGMKGANLETRVVISTTEKEPLYRILEVLKLAGIDAVDLCYSSFGDYYACKDKKTDDEVGAIINIGEASTNISIFNKGIQIKNTVIPVGSRNVDKDLTYIYKTKMSESRKIKENFAVALSSYADSNDVWKAEVDRGVIKEINQVDISKVVEARVRETLKLAKNEIKNLTNREIRYIIITGGLSELAGFNYLVEQELGFVASVCNITTMGIRHNKYSSCLGTIKYFNDKLDLRGKHYNMLTKEEEQILTSGDEKNIPNESVIKKVFGHFFDD